MNRICIPFRICENDMRKGVIVLVPFPFTDLTANKVRPCLILVEQKKGEDCVVACISSIKTQRRNVFDVKVKASNENGLKTDSIIRTGKIATLQKKIILGELGVLEKTHMKSVDAKLKALFLL